MSLPQVVFSRLFWELWGQPVACVALQDAFVYLGGTEGGVFDKAGSGCFPPLLTRQKVPWPILCSCDQLARGEKRFVASHNNGMPTCEITIYIGYRSTSPLNLSLLMNLATIEGRVTGVGDGRGPPPSRLQSLVEEKDGTFS